MPKKKRRTNHAKLGNRRHTQASAASRRHADYKQPCPDHQLIEEFGEEGAQWLLDKYQRPLNMADFQLENAIRRDVFVMDDPFTGPVTYTAQKISETLDMTFRFIVLMATQAGTLTHEQAREAEEINADPFDHAADGPDVVREAHREGALILNHRGMWDFSEGEA